LEHYLPSCDSDLDEPVGAIGIGRVTLVPVENAERATRYEATPTLGGALGGAMATEQVAGRHVP